MSDYNWKSCADPANAARLRELLEAGREVLMTWHRIGRPMREYFGVNPKDAELIASLLKERNLDVFSFLDPNDADFLDPDGVCSNAEKPLTDWRKQIGDSVYTPHCPYCTGQMKLQSELRGGCDLTDPDAFAYYYRCIACASQSGWAKSPSGAKRFAEMRPLPQQSEASQRFPANTCSSSRHAFEIGESLMTGEDYPMLREEPIHCGESITHTAIDLWKTRTDNAELKARIEDLIRCDDEENR